MLRWALGFFIVALIAAVFGFGGIAVAASEVAKIIFFVFLILFVVALFRGTVKVLTWPYPTLLNFPFFGSQRPP